MGDLTLFDYAGIPAETATEVRAAAERIRVRMKRTAEDIIAIGLDLIAVKDRLPHGAFLPWIESEFGMSDQTARRFMQVADRYGKSNIMLNLPPTVLFELAAPSTPEPVRDLIEQKAAANETVSVEEVKRLKRELAEKDKATKRAERESERAKHAVEAEKAKAADLLGQVKVLKENAEAVRLKAEQEAEAKTAAERQRLLTQISETEAKVERVRHEMEIAAKAQAEAAAQAELAKLDEEVKAARRKEADTKANVDRLRAIEAEQRKRIDEHQAFLSKMQNADAEAKDLLDQMAEFDRAVSSFALVLSGVEYEHGGKIAATAISLSDRCEKLRLMLVAVGRPRLIYDAEAVNG